MNIKIAYNDRVDITTAYIDGRLVGRWDGLKIVEAEKKVYNFIEEKEVNNGKDLYSRKNDG